MASMDTVQPRSFGYALRSWMFTAQTVYLLALSACSLIYSGDLDKTQCKVQTDCDSAATRLGMLLLCKDDVCQARTCTQAKDCPANSACTNNQCVARSVDAGM